jgi:hypothetical protein
MVAYDVFFLCGIQMMVHYGWMDVWMYGLKTHLGSSFENLGYKP